MNEAARKIPLSPADYLAGEQLSELRHEYVEGAVYAMTGARKTHNLVAGNLARALHAHLRGTPCQVFISDIKVHVAWDWRERYYYPDVVVACEPDDVDPYVIEKPKLIVEVLSESTERKDRADKFYAYRRLGSLQEYVLVAQDAARVEVYRRDTGWDLEIYEVIEALIELRSIGLSLTVREVYEGLPELLGEKKL
ncbi:MAG: Uma2 family endonuclease [Candidatus Competibacteraceae bacterium]|nr:Uma2 family endonuclease [Candidatus Competibacteraceae bacterium]